MFKTIRFTTAALIASCATLWACSSADAQVYDVQIDAVAPEDIPELGIEAGNPAVFGATLDFTGTVPVHPNPVSSIYGAVPGSDAALAIDGPGAFQHMDGSGVTADVLIDGGFHFVEFHIQDASPFVEVDGFDIGATGVQISIVLGDLTGDALFPTGDLPDLLDLDNQLNTFEVLQFDAVVETGAGDFPIDLNITGMDVIELDPPEPAYFHKYLVDGPDRDGDGEIDLIIEANSKELSEYTFRIEVNQPDQPPMRVRDVIPSDWSVVEAAPDNASDTVLIGNPLPGEVTFISWRPTENSGGLTITVWTRSHGHHHYLPRKCGPLAINPLGAAAWDADDPGQRLLDADGNPLVTNPLFIGAMKDKDHDDMIDWSGNGDEDEDGLLDAEEIFEVGTDPCKQDTDHDHVDDGNDRFPLDRHRW